MTLTDKEPVVTEATPEPEPERATTFAQVAVDLRVEVDDLRAQIEVRKVAMSRQEEDRNGQYRVDRLQAERDRLREELASLQPGPVTRSEPTPGFSTVEEAAANEAAAKLKISAPGGNQGTDVPVEVDIPAEIAAAAKAEDDAEAGILPSTLDSTSTPRRGR